MPLSLKACELEIKLHGRVTYAESRGNTWQMTHSIDAIDYILNSVRRGDSNALESLYHTLSRPLFAYLRRMGLAPHDADDIVQTVFSRIWLYRESYKGNQGRAWVYQIARNCLYDLQSTARSYTEPQEIDAKDFGPEQSLQESQMHKRILQALETLPPLSREAIVLSRFSGLSNSEIAQLLTLTPNNVKVRIHRALAKLKEALYDA